MNLLKTITFTAVALAIGLIPALAMPVRAGQIPASVTPAGKWETTGGESRYEIEFCGDGTQICAGLKHRLRSSDKDAMSMTGRQSRWIVVAGLAAVALTIGACAGDSATKTVTVTVRTPASSNASTPMPPRISPAGPRRATARAKRRRPSHRSCSRRCRRA